MKVIGSRGYRRQFLATATATQADQHIAVVIAVIGFVAFVAAVPFVRVPLARMPGFVPNY
jgi:hypothetical protein